MNLVVYIKDGCHLCEQMLAELEQLSLPDTLHVDTVVIDANESLLQQYGTKVPVLVYGGREVCHYFLDPTALQQALDANG